ncbi:MAG TPA: metallophosphoesterase [Chthoniobacterales bacterium]
MRPVTSFAALEEVLAVDTTSIDGAFWSSQPRASFAVVGDFGSGFNAPDGTLTNRINVNAKAVADGIRRVLPWTGEGSLISVGDAIYVPFDGQNSPNFPNQPETWLATNLTPYDQAIGTLYHPYIKFPPGSQSAFARKGSRTQRFLNVLGDHDWWHQPRNPVSGMLEFRMDEAKYPAAISSSPQPGYILPPEAEYMQYFSNQGAGSTSHSARYFDRADGNVHWFALSSDANETLLGTLANAYYFGPYPDGYSPGMDNLLHSRQGQWFHKAVRRSRAPWKFVVTHYPPYTSSAPDLAGHNSAVYMRWGFERYGVDAVFSGHVHAYERLYANGVTYVVTGGGGTFEPFAGFTDPQPGSQRRVKNRYGFVAADDRDGKIFFRYMSVRTPGTTQPPAVQDRFVLVRGGTLDSIAEIEQQNGIHITSGGGTIQTQGFSATIAGGLVGRGELGKTGDGVLQITKPNPDFTGRIIILQGEVALLASQAFGEATAWTLAGGTLRVTKGRLISTHPLRVEGTTSIILEQSGKLSFPASAAEAWTGRLAITGLAGRRLRIGINSAGLTSSQLEAIHFPDNPGAVARIDAGGYLIFG